MLFGVLKIIPQWKLSKNHLVAVNSGTYFCPSLDGCFGEGAYPPTVGDAWRAYSHSDYSSKVNVEISTSCPSWRCEVRDERGHGSPSLGCSCAAICGCLCLCVTALFASPLVSSGTSQVDKDRTLLSTWLMCPVDCMCVSVWFWSHEKFRWNSTNSKMSAWETKETIGPKNLQNALNQFGYVEPLRFSNTHW